MKLQKLLRRLKFDKEKDKIIGFFLGAAEKTVCDLDISYFSIVVFTLPFFVLDIIGMNKGKWKYLKA